MDIDELWVQAQDALAAGDLEAAERAGRALLDRRHSSSFEILAHVALAREEHAEAIDILEQGTALAPTAIPLWQLLGNTLSVLGRSTEAWAAYESALEHAGGPAPSIRLNRAIFQLRLEEPDLALAELDAVEPGPLAALFADVRITALLEAGRGEEAVAAAQAFVPHPDMEGVERFHEAHAIALWQVHRDPVLAATQLGKARVGGSPRALWLLREIWGADVDEGQEFHVIGAGVEPQPYVQPVRIVAGDEAQAMHFARTLGDWLGWAAVDSVEAVGPVGPARAGIYEVGGRIVHEPE